MKPSEALELCDALSREIFSATDCTEEASDGLAKFLIMQGWVTDYPDWWKK